MSAAAPLGIEGSSLVSHKRLLPRATLDFADVFDEEELLISWQRDRSVDVSGVSLLELQDIRLWVSNTTLCLYTEGEGVDHELSLFHADFDLEHAQQTPLRRLEGTVVVLPHLDPHNYYHWLIDTVPCFGVLELGGVRLEEVDWFYIHRLENDFQRRSLEQLGVDPSRIIVCDGSESHYGIDRLLVPQFRMDGAAWPNPWATSYLKRLYLPGDQAKAPRQASSTSPSLVYVRRGDARRAVTNENELEERLKAIGFTVLAPETHSFEGQARALARADGVLGSHGAGLANIVFCQPGTPVMEFGGHYITTHFRIIARLANLKYWAIGAGMDEHGERLPLSFDGDIRNLDFVCDVDAVVGAAADWFGL